MVVPNKSKYRKQFRGKMRGRATSGTRVAFGEYGLKAVGRGWLRQRHVEAARQAMVHATKREGKIWLRVVNDKPITSKTSGATMGGGKGEVVDHVAVIKPGRVIFEIGGVGEEEAKRALKLAADKLPFKTKIISNQLI